MDFTLYWFMFPVAVVVATSGMLSGIGGAALFTPLFMAALPALGAAFGLADPATAVAAALLTGTFGLTSGAIGYAMKGLIDFRSALPYLAVAVPSVTVGGVSGHYADPDVLKLIYAALVLIPAAIMLRGHHHKAVDSGPMLAGQGASAGAMDVRGIRNIATSDGTVYSYRAPRQGLAAVITSFGAFMTGMVSVGIGESVMIQFRRQGMPVAVAAGTSIFIVIVTVAFASAAQISALVLSDGIRAVPWNLVAYTIPGAIIGGQIGPRLQGRIGDTVMERIIGAIFVAVSIAMTWLVMAS